MIEELESLKKNYESLAKMISQYERLKNTLEQELGYGNDFWEKLNWKIISALYSEYHNVPYPNESEYKDIKDFNELIKLVNKYLSKANYLALKNIANKLSYSILTNKTRVGKRIFIYHVSIYTLIEPSLEISGLEKITNLWKLVEIVFFRIKPAKATGYTMWAIYNYKHRESEGLFDSINISNSIIKSCKLYKNGKFEIVFRKEDDAKKFERVLKKIRRLGK